MAHITKGQGVAGHSVHVDTNSAACPSDSCVLGASSARKSPESGCAPEALLTAVGDGASSTAFSVLDQEFLFSSDVYPADRTFVRHRCHLWFPESPSLIGETTAKTERQGTDKGSNNPHLVHFYSLLSNRRPPRGLSRMSQGSRAHRTPGHWSTPGRRVRKKHA